MMTIIAMYIFKHSMMFPKKLASSGKLNNINAYSGRSIQPVKGVNITHPFVDNVLKNMHNGQ